VKVLPSEVAAAIDGLFGPRTSDIDDHRVGPQFQADVSTIISLLDQVPTEFIDFGIIHYTELMNAGRFSLPPWEPGRVARKYPPLPSTPRIRLNASSTSCCFATTSCHHPNLSCRLLMTNRGE
jgi:hypothetical protein